MVFVFSVVDLIPMLRARPEYQLRADIHSHKAGTESWYELGHSGPSRLHNFPRLKMQTLHPKDIGRSSQRHKCGTNLEFHPIVLTSGLEIEFYFILTLK